MGSLSFALNARFLCLCLSLFLSFPSFDYEDVADVSFLSTTKTNINMFTGLCSYYQDQ